MYISKKYSEKLEKHLCGGLSCESWEITYHSFEIQQRSFFRNLTKLLFGTFKNKKALMVIWRKICNCASYPAIVIELYINNQQRKKEHLRLAISSISVSVVAKTADEVYVLIFITIYSYFSFFFYCTKEGRVVEKISKVM